MTTTLNILLSAVYLAVSTALFTAALVLAILFHYRITPHVWQNNHWFPPLPINYVLPQQPPPALFYPPLPHRAPAIDEHSSIVDRRDEEDVPGEVEVGVQEGSNGSIARAGLPHVQSSPTRSSHHSSAGTTPHRAQNPASAADLARYLVRLGLGTSGEGGSPAPEQSTSSRPRNVPIPAASNGPHNIFVSSTSELNLVWDNLNLPYTAFFPP